MLIHKIRVFRETPPTCQLLNVINIINDNMQRLKGLFTYLFIAYISIIFPSVYKSLCHYTPTTPPHNKITCSSKTCFLREGLCQDVFLFFFLLRTTPYPMSDGNMAMVRWSITTWFIVKIRFTRFT